MNFTATKLSGAYIIEADRRDDERGYFARTFIRGEFEAHGLDAPVAETAVSYNRQGGTLRGMHYQVPPHEQAKLVRCLRGAIFDVIIDLRADSATYREWCAVDLAGGTLRALYIPPGFAHGLQTVEEDTEVLYHLSVPRHAASERGLRWDDPAFTIKWPLPISCLSERDGSYPFFGEKASVKP